MKAVIDIMWEEVYDYVDIDLSSLDASFFLEEIKVVVFSFKGDKSLIPDGFTMYFFFFFQSFWDLIKDDPFALFLQLRNCNLDLLRFN